MSAGGYAEAYGYDVRRSGRVKLGGLDSQWRYGSSTSLPADLLLSVLLSKSLSALALHVAKDWLLDTASYSAWKLNAVVGAEPSSPLYPFLFAFESLFAFLALSHLSVLRFFLLTSFAPLWTRGMPFIKTGGRKAVGPSNALFMTAAMVVVSYLVDSALSGGISRAGYLYILLHLLAAGQRSEIFASYNGDDRARGLMHANGVAVGAAFSGILAFVHSLFASSAPAQPVATSTSAFFSPPSSSLSLNLGSATFLALIYLVADPLLTRALLAHFPPVKILRAGWPLAAGSSAFVGYVGFGRGVGLGEGAVGLIAWNAISHILSTDPRSSSVSVSSSSASVATSSSTKTVPLFTRLSTFYRHLRATVKTILASPESRRIYFFLCLNLAFMFVQMAYGIWTNSLGLISDSIHMFFDCLALAMGLFASVMASWPSNEKYTYGYSRVETLSGFANGLFLCLISIFIVFEAIERLIDPPEMNTGQLLTVSAVGLAVNLVGMAATGGHHGHSHGGGGGHGHSHGHSHAPVKSKSTPFLTEKEEVEEDDHHGHSHNGHSHASSSHSHAHAATPPRPTSSHGHSHSHAPSPSHSHGAASPATHSSQSHASHDESSHGHAHANGSHDACDHDEDDEGDAEHAGGGHGSHNMKGVFLHVMADTLGSVGVIISTLLINRYGWTGFDPLASIFIAVLIFASVVPLIVDSGKLLVLDMGEEKEAEVRKALTAVQRLEGVSSFSRARFWRKDPSSMVGSICIQLAPAPGYAHTPHVAPKSFANIEKTTARVRRALRANIGGLEEVVIQVEPTGGLELRTSAALE